MKDPGRFRQWLKAAKNHKENLKMRKTSMFAVNISNWMNTNSVLGQMEVGGEMKETAVPLIRKKRQTAVTYRQETSYYVT